MPFSLPKNIKNNSKSPSNNSSSFITKRTSGITPQPEYSWRKTLLKRVKMKSTPVRNFVDKL